MEGTKFVYTFDCVNCGLPFTFEHKSDSIETATCPMCLQGKQFPKTVVRQEQLLKARFDDPPVSS